MPKDVRTHRLYCRKIDSKQNCQKRWVGMDMEIWEKERGICGSGGGGERLDRSRSSWWRRFVDQEETMHKTREEEAFWLQLANLLGQMTSPIGRIQDLVVENGKVEGQTQPDRVCWLHLGAGHFKRFLVRSLRVVHYAFEEGRDRG